MPSSGLKKEYCIHNKDANLVPAPTLDSTTACDVNSDACWVAALPEEKSKIGHSTSSGGRYGRSDFLTQRRKYTDGRDQPSTTIRESETDLPADTSWQEHKFQVWGKIILQIFRWEEKCSLPVETKSRLVSF